MSDTGSLAGKRIFRLLALKLREVQRNQLTAGEVYDVVFLNDSDTHRYTDAPLSLRVFGAGQVSDRPASAVYGWMK